MENAHKSPQKRRNRGNTFIKNSHIATPTMSSNNKKRKNKTGKKKMPGTVPAPESAEYASNGVWPLDWFEQFKRTSPWYLTNDTAHQVLPQYRDAVPSTCEVCKRGPLTGTPVQMCSRCRIVCYCGREHQRVDFKSGHKEQCKIFTKTKELMAGLHIPGAKDDAKEPLSQKQWDAFLSKSLWAMEQVCPGVEMRNSGVVEKWANQLKCARCRARCRTLSRCERCFGVGWCKNCYRTPAAISSGAQENPNAEGESEGAGPSLPDLGMDLGVGPEEHSRRDCDNYILIAAVQGCLSVYGHPLHVPSLVSCKVVKDQPGGFHLPSTWAEYFTPERRRSIVQHFFGGDTSLLSAPMFAMLTDGLSLPMTILHALVEVYGRERVGRMKRLVIHLVGATLDEAAALRRFEEIANILPKCRSIQLVMVGPAHRNRVGGQPKVDVMDVSGPNHRCSVKTEFHHTSYEEFCEGAGVGREAPTLVAAQHSGADDPSFQGQWLPAICALRDMSVPVMMTGYTMLEATEAAQWIAKPPLACAITRQPKRNPLRGLVPRSDPQCDAVYGNFYYYNCAYFCWQGAAAP